MIDNILANIRRYIPRRIFSFFQPAYHMSMSFLAAMWYRFPSKEIAVIGVTGTKGKSSTVEILSAILEEAGYVTAISNTIRSKIAGDSVRNLYKMSMPGRFFIQRFLRQAVRRGCHYVILEMTSQGALMYRHRWIDLDALIFTNLSPEHIEAHGSYDNYADAKLSIARTMEKSCKDERTLIVKADDDAADRFMECTADRKITYSIHDVEPYESSEHGLKFTYSGRRVSSRLPGTFNLYNILAAATAAKSQGVSDDMIIRAVEKIDVIPGRVQRIEVGSMTDSSIRFSVIVDYAHTPDSLEKLYQALPSSGKICILGGTGGGRDTWKRAEMGRIADTHCREIILTDEDPYDEDPRKIVDDVAQGIVSKKPTIIMDRRQAIVSAIGRARGGDLVIITGKGTDPYIMGPCGSKLPWSDADVVNEEIVKLKK